MEDERARVRLQLDTSFRFAANVCVDVARCLVAVKPVGHAAANAGHQPLPLSSGKLRIPVDVDVTNSIAIADPPRARGTVFVLYGVRDSKKSMRRWGDVVVGAGYRAMLVDLRGHGSSTGHVLSYGAREAEDLRRALDHLEARGLCKRSSRRD